MAIKRFPPPSGPLRGTAGQKGFGDFFSSCRQFFEFGEMVSGSFLVKTSRTTNALLGLEAKCAFAAPDGISPPAAIISRMAKGKLLTKGVKGMLPLGCLPSGGERGSPSHLSLELPNLLKKGTPLNTNFRKLS